MFRILDGLIHWSLLNSSFYVQYVLGMLLMYLKVLISSIGIGVHSVIIVGELKTTWEIEENLE